MSKTIIILACLSCNEAYAQNVLNGSSNMLRNGDCVAMQPLDFSWEGATGEKVVWDFSGIDNLGGSREVELMQDSLGNYHKTENFDMYTYMFSGDSLLLAVKENRLEHIIYNLPKVAMVYPFQYGDSLMANFSGDGSYCGDHQVRVCGQVRVKADGFGSLILSDKDTLDNVLRVYTMTTTSMAVDMDSAKIDPERLKQEIEEKYEWYARGYRYPLYETVLRTSYSNLVPVATKGFAYRLLPDSITLQQDEENDSIRKSDLAGKHEGDSSNDDIIHYQVHKKGCDVTVEYSLDKDAHIIGIVADIMGIVYKTVSQSGKAGDQLAMAFNCQGLRPGQYVIYINVNGKVYNEKISL